MSARAALDNRASMTPQPVSLLCQYNTGILRPREEGGSRGGTEEGAGEGPRKGGRTQEGGRESRAERSGANVGGARFLRSLVVKKIAVFGYFSILGKAVLGPGEVVFTAVQQSSVKAVQPAASTTHLTYE